MLNNRGGHAQETVWDMESTANNCIAPHRNAGQEVALGFELQAAEKLQHHRRSPIG